MAVQVADQGGVSGLLGRTHVFALPALFGFLENFDFALRQLQLHLHALRGLGAVDLEHIVLQLVMCRRRAGLSYCDAKVVDHGAQVVDGGMAYLLGRGQVAEHDGMRSR